MGLGRDQSPACPGPGWHVAAASELPGGAVQHEHHSMSRPAWCTRGLSLGRRVMIAQAVSIDEAKLGAFEERLVDALNAGALCLMTSIGHRTGLFDAMAAIPPGTCAQVAAAAGLNER